MQLRTKSKIFYLGNNKEINFGRYIIYCNLSHWLCNRVVYLKSTDIEQMHYERLLWSIPDDWFYQWYKKNTIVLKEKSTHIDGGKIIRIFIPVLIDLFRKIYFNQDELVNKKFINHFNLAYQTLTSNKLLYTKYMYWKGLIEEIKIKVVYKKVDKEVNLLK